MNTAIAVLALATFIALVCLGAAIQRQVPRKKGDRIQLWRWVYAFSVASALALMILVFR